MDVLEKVKNQVLGIKTKIPYALFIVTLLTALFTIIPTSGHGGDNIFGTSLVICVEKAGVVYKCLFKPILYDIAVKCCKGILNATVKRISKHGRSLKLVEVLSGITIKSRDCLKEDHCSDRFVESGFKNVESENQENLTCLKQKGEADLLLMINHLRSELYQAYKLGDEERVTQILTKVKTLLDQVCKVNELRIKTPPKIEQNLECHEQENSFKVKWHGCSEQNFIVNSANCTKDDLEKKDSDASLKHSLKEYKAGFEAVNGAVNQMHMYIQEYSEHPNLQSAGKAQYKSNCVCSNIDDDDSKANIADAGKVARQQNLRFLNQGNQKTDISQCLSNGESCLSSLDEFRFILLENHVLYHKTLKMVRNFSIYEVLNALIHQIMELFSLICCCVGEFFNIFCRIVVGWLEPCMDGNDGRSSGNGGDKKSGDSGSQSSEGSSATRSGGGEITGSESGIGGSSNEGDDPNEQKKRAPDRPGGCKNSTPVAKKKRRQDFDDKQEDANLESAEHGQLNQSGIQGERSTVRRLNFDHLSQYSSINGVSGILDTPISPQPDPINSTERPSLGDPTNLGSLSVNANFGSDRATLGLPLNNRTNTSLPQPNQKQMLNNLTSPQTPELSMNLSQLNFGPTNNPRTPGVMSPLSPTSDNRWDVFDAIERADRNGTNDFNVERPEVRHDRDREAVHQHSFANISNIPTTLPGLPRNNTTIPLDQDLGDTGQIEAADNDEHVDSPILHWDRGRNHSYAQPRDVQSNRIQKNASLPNEVVSTQPARCLDVQCETVPLIFPRLEDVRSGYTDVPQNSQQVTDTDQDSDFASGPVTSISVYRPQTTDRFPLLTANSRVEDIGERDDGHSSTRRFFHIDFWNEFSISHRGMRQNRIMEHPEGQDGRRYWKCSRDCCRSIVYSSQFGSIRCEGCLLCFCMPECLIKHRCHATSNFESDDFKKAI